ncbi:hypothetical protein EV1_019638 [Malus domestica]
MTWAVSFVWESRLLSPVLYIPLSASLELSSPPEEANRDAVSGGRNIITGLRTCKRKSEKPIKYNNYHGSPR